MSWFRGDYAGLDDVGVEIEVDVACKRFSEDYDWLIRKPRHFEG